jgi:DNA-directed RNA polymerase specialized sigma24 family protein
VAFRGQIALEGLRARDPVALREVVDQHGRRLNRAARGMGFSPGDAEDLAQDVFVTFRLGRIARLIADDFEREPTSGFEGRILERLGS